MNRQEIMAAIKNLAMSQGFYSRLYEKLSDNSVEADEYLSQLEAQNFSDTVDMVLYIES